MPTPKQIEKMLNQLTIPGFERSLGKMNLIKDVKITDHRVEVNMFSTAIPLKFQDIIKAEIQKGARELDGIEKVTTNFITALPKDLNCVTHVIAIMSGKGGVGKSLVSALTAISLRRQGYEVGILDADITGPSVPKMFGLHERPTGSDTGILPVLSRTRIEIMSINLLLPDEDNAIIWRGPLIGRAITQFWEEVLWGSLDYLIVDLPPGTADAPLTVLKSLPVSGIIIVFTPQDLTAMVVRKAISMTRQMEKPILGVVENMSYLYVPEIKKNIEIFGQSHAAEMSEAAGAPLLGQIPIDPQLAKLCDEGNIEFYESDLVKTLGRKLAGAAPVKKTKTVKPG